MGFYMIFLGKSASGIKGPKQWAAGSLIVGIGILIKMIQPANGFLPLAGSPLLICVGLYFYLAGIWSFKGKKIINWIAFGVPAVDIIQSIIFFQFFFSDRIRVGIHTTLIIFYCVIAIYEMLNLPHDKKYLKNIFRLNAFSFLIFMFLLFANLAAVVFSKNFNPASINEPAKILFVISGFLMIALTFGFLTAVNLQLNSELEEQLKLKTKFFSIVAHDLRGPIGTIMNVTNLLNTAHDLTKTERQSLLNGIESLSRSTAHLTQNLFDWAATSTNPDQVENEIIELNELVESNSSFFKSMANLKKIDIEFKNEGRPAIVGNRKMIDTVLRNLVSNSIKFTPNGGHISIKTGLAHDKVQLAVVDTGIGIEADKIEDLFNFGKSESTKGTNGESGSGFGLVLCNEFVKKNNGIIKIESKLNMGTGITVEFSNPVTN